MKSIIVANWKMNPEKTEDAIRLLEEVQRGVVGLKNVQIVICPPFPYIALFDMVKYPSLKMGGQNCFWEEKGTVTGEVSLAMLKNLGCEYVIVGHSERKKYLGETSEMARKKLEAATRSQLRPILCVENPGELQEVLKDADKNVASFLIAVYEPSRAISSEGEGNAESPLDVKEKISSMKGMLKEMLGTEVPVLYGGSVDATNIRSFLTEAGADGALVGHASLSSVKFLSLVKEASLR